MSYFLQSLSPPLFFFFFFNDTATTEIYTLSLHDALPICRITPMFTLNRMHDENSSRLFINRIPTTTFLPVLASVWLALCGCGGDKHWRGRGDRKSTRLNSSHTVISYAVFCLKKKNNKKQRHEDSCPHDTPFPVRINGPRSGRQRTRRGLLQRQLQIRICN